MGCAILMKIASKSKHQLVKREAISYSLEQVQTGFRFLVRYHVWRTGIDFRCDLLRMSLNLHHRSTQVNLLRRQSSLPNRPTRQSSYGGTEARCGHKHLFSHFFFKNYCIKHLKVENWFLWPYQENKKAKAETFIVRKHPNVTYQAQPRLTQQHKHQHIDRF